MGIFKEEMDTHLDHLIEREFQIPSTFLIGKEGRKEVPPATIRLRSNSLATGRDLKGLTFVLFPVFEQVQVSSWQPIQREQQRGKKPTVLPVTSPLPYQMSPRCPCWPQWWESLSRSALSFEMWRYVQGPPIGNKGKEVLYSLCDLCRISRVWSEWEEHKGRVCPLVPGVS